MSNPPAVNPKLWATDLNYAPGAEPWANQPTKVLPPAGMLQKGAIPGQQLAAEHYNYVLGNYGDWLSYLSKAHLPQQALNWPEQASTSALGSVDGKLGLGYAPDLGVNGCGLWVVQTTGTDVLTSEDGRTWTQRAASLASASFTNPWISYGKVNGASGFLLSQNANPNVYYTSLDGITWTLQSTASTPVPANPVSAWSQSLGLWVLAGNAGTVSTSPTGLANSWTARSTPGTWASSSGGVKSIAWNGSLFVALPVASYNKVLTSPDGIVWTERTLPATALWTGLAYGTYDGVWMVSAGNADAVATSADGITWVAAAAANYWSGNDLACFGALWVIPTVNAGRGGIIWSVDKGASWNGVAVGSHRVATSGWNRILLGDSRFMLAHIVTSGAVEVAMSLRK